MEQHWEELNRPVPPPKTSYKASLRRRSLGIVLLMLVCGFVLSAGSVLAFYFLPNPSLLFGEEKLAGDADKLLHVEFRGDEFVMPEPVVRAIDRGVTGSVRRIELRVPWPFEAENIKGLTASQLNELEGSLFLSFETNTNKLSTSDHFNKIIRRFVAGQPEATPSGLIRYQFAKNSPYANEELFVGEFNGKQVNYRCARDEGKYGPSLCARVIPVSGKMIARYRFHRQYLKDWIGLEATVRELIKTFRIPGAG
ncbi:MAG: hypothetical protein ACR2OJ_04075 [Hyphomicrobiales bacterium]